MKMLAKPFVLLCFLLIAGTVVAQKARKADHRSPRQTLVYDDISYLPEIRSVQLHNAQQEQSFPVIRLNSDEQLFLSFDDLRADIRNYFYSIEHCNAKWESSNLGQLEYVDGFNEDRIYAYQRSVNTLQPYTYYSLTFPTRNLRPTLPGNYLLKVYEAGDRSRLVLTRRFYVLSEQTQLQMQIQPSFENTKRRTNQKLNVTVNTGALTINNPYQDLKVLVMQNRRPDIQEWLEKPMFVQNNQLIYNNNKTLDFPGGSEFRFVDLRSLRLQSERVRHISRDSMIHVTLFPDHSRQNESYAGTFDENGAFYIRNQDMADDQTSAEYALVTFYLEDVHESNQDIYITGLFNSYLRNASSRMSYNTEHKRHEVTLLLKQGLYDYTYVLADQDGKTDPTHINGNHFETGNSYQVLCYYRKPGTRWDELVAYHTVNSRNND